MVLVTYPFRNEDFMNIVSVIVTVVVTVIASSGFWTFLQRKTETKNVNFKMLLGLGHDRIVFLGQRYIKRGWITKDEYENLHDYLYTPYIKMGGNGAAKRVMTEVERLPLK